MMNEIDNEEADLSSEDEKIKWLFIINIIQI